MQHVYGEFINSSCIINICNNIGIGYNVIILKSTTIGNNVFIAANSLVNKDIPSNYIAGGYPAKVLCTLDEYREKRLSHFEAEAMDYARSITERFRRMPKVEEFYEEFSLFADRENADRYNTLNISSQLGKKYSLWLKSHNRKYNDFEDFLRASI